MSKMSEQKMPHRYTEESLRGVLTSGALVRRQNGEFISTIRKQPFSQMLVIEQKIRNPSTKNVNEETVIISCKVIAFMEDGTTHTFNDWHFMLSDFDTFMEVCRAD